MDSLTRRSFLITTAVAASAATSSSPPGPIRLGGPVFLKTEDPVELAREHRRLGYSAAYCPKAEAGDTARTKAIREAFAAENVAIAEVGAWVNMLDPDSEKRRENLRYVTQRLALAEAVEARCCVDIAGSFNPKVWYGPHPKNLSREFFDATVENCRKVIDEIKPQRTKFSIEMMGWALPDSPDSYLELIKAVDRDAFAVHVDVCNMINSPGRFYNSGALIEETFRKLGKWVVSCHAKDLEWNVEMNVHFREVIPGRGEVDYRTYLKEVSKLPVAAPLMIEHLEKPEEYEEGKNYIKKVGKGLGLTFA